MKTPTIWTVKIKAKLNECYLVVVHVLVTVFERKMSFNIATKFICICITKRKDVPTTSLSLELTGCDIA